MIRNATFIYVLNLCVAGCGGTPAHVPDSDGSTDVDAGVDSGGPVCGNGFLEGSEECDNTSFGEADCLTEAGHLHGTLLCTDACAIDTTECHTCGDGQLDGPEVCDGTNLSEETCWSRAGLTEGVLGCLPTCMEFDTSDCHTCGDGIMHGPESCDGSDLGGQTCLSVTGLVSGTLSCDHDCTIEVSACYTCGNGVVEADEICDDGNVETWDGCDDACTVTEFRVNDDTIGDQRYPAVSMTPNGEVVVVWRDFTTGNIDGKIYLSSGQVGAVFTEAAGAWGFPSVASWSDGFVVAWGVFGGGVYARTYQIDGTPVVGPLLVGYNGQSLNVPRVAVSPSGDFVVVWRSKSGGLEEVKGRMYTVDGTPLGPEFIVDYGFVYSPAVAVAGDGSFTVAWRRDERDIWRRYYDAAGVPSPSTVVAGVLNWVSGPDVACRPDDDRILISYAVNDPGSLRVACREYYADQTPGNSYTVYGSALVPADVTSLLGPRGVYLYDSASTHAMIHVWAEETAAGRRTRGSVWEGQGLLFTPNLYAAPHVNVPALASAPGPWASKIVVVWTSIGQDGDGSGVYAQRYTFSPSPVHLRPIGVNPW